MSNVGASITNQSLPPADPANLSNSVTGLYGITGSGKSSIADTGIEYCWEVFQKISLVYAADLGGYGSKRLALIRRGIAIVYDPRNHADPFSTMELCSLGAFPAYLLPGGGATREEREKGYAPPDAELVLPHRQRFTVKAADGAVVGQCYDVPQAQTWVQQHPGSTIITEVVRTTGFARVGHRVYDSLTALNEWGMDDLQAQSAKGLLPASNDKGGRALGSADALVSGKFRFAGSSVAQYGFLQNRTYGWLANIRSIPDQVVPATVTFMVEKSKGDDESGGAMIYGPKIAGNARTSALGGWLGNQLYVAYEPNAEGVMVRRLWLENHVDPRDASGIPYVAKHRGTPLGMPAYLEDPPEPGKEWSQCSLGVLFHKLNEQISLVDAALAAKYPDAPGMPLATDSAPEEVVRTVAGAAMAGAGGARVAAPLGAAGAVSQPGTQPAASIPGRRTFKAVGAPAAPAAAAAPVTLTTVAAPVTVTTPSTSAVAAVTAPAVPEPGAGLAVPLTVSPVAQVTAGLVPPGSGLTAAVGTPTPAAPPVSVPSAPRTVATRSRVPRPPV